METSSAASLERRSGSVAASPWSTQLAWFAVGAGAAFLVPFVFSSVLGLQHDVYLAIYFAFVVGLLTTYVRRNEIDAAEAIRRNWKWGVLAGVVIGVPVLRNVFTENASAHPHGFYYGFELIWRGALYGAIDATLLTVFPCLVVLTAMGGSLRTWGRRIMYFASSLGLVLAITATYHLGYDHYRSAGVRAPETGNTLMSVPMLLTANPIGSVLDHSAMHVAAVVHEYGGDTRLPPQTKAR